MRKILLPVLLLVFIHSSAQVATRKIDADELQKLGLASPQSNRRVVKMPTVDVEALKRQDLKEAQIGLPPRFGQSIDVDLGLGDGTWNENENERVWSLVIQSAGAYSINLIFDDFYLSKDAKLFIYNEQHTMLLGPITNEQNNSGKKFATDLVAGSAIVIELIEPKTASENSTLHISNVIHAYKNVGFAGYGESSECNNNINCPQFADWQNEANAVAMVIVNGNRHCSGVLLNNACQDFTPNFLTAFHCLDTNPNDDVLSQAERDAVNTWVFRFQYESPTCASADDAAFFSFSGATFRAAWRNTDFALMELFQRPTANTGIEYAGWSRVNVASPAGASITHPQGDVMKIALYNQVITQQVFLGSNDWRVVWNDGTVEPGSSGGPLFNDNGLVIGQVHGGNPEDICTTNDHAFFGRFDLSWNGGGTADTQLSAWLTNDPNITQINTIPISSLTGPSLICTSGTFTLNNAPATTISWSVSPSNLVSPSSGTGATANVSLVSNGNSTITFSVGCGNPATFAMDFHTGPYSSSDYPISGPSSASCNNDVYYSIPTLAGVTRINWIWPSDWTYSSGQGTTNLALIAGPSSGIVGAGVDNTCGPSGSYATIYTTMFCSSISSMAVYPNPASNELNVSFKENSSKINAKESLEWAYDLKVYNAHQELIYAVKSDRKEIKINTQNFPRGTYILNILHGEAVIQKKVFIIK